MKIQSKQLDAGYLLNTLREQGRVSAYPELCHPRRFDNQSSRPYNRPVCERCFQSPFLANCWELAPPAGTISVIMQFPIRVAVDTLPALIVGGVLLCAAAAMALKQWWAFRRLNSNPNVDETAYQHTERQIHSRLSVSGLLFLLGVLIPMGDQLENVFVQRPGLFFAYWIGVLLLVFVMVVMALMDLLSTIAYTKSTRVRLGMERRAIEEDIRRYRASRNHAGGQNPENN
jgi:hypothetical protein